jgi:ubiquitin carboxyl-terminal hydrolase 8
MSYNPQDKIEVRGLSGLNNIGNTCYMNSALQCLSASDMFTGYLIKKYFVGDLKENIVQNLADITRKKKRQQGEDIKDDDDVSVYLKEIKKHYYSSMTYNTYKLFKALWKSNSCITPKSFKQNLGEHCKSFRNFSQQDSQEFINFVLDKIHEEIKCEVYLKYKNVPEDIIEYITQRKDFCKKIQDEKNPGLLEAKIKILETFVNEHQREETIFKSLEYWDGYIKKNHSPIIDIFSGLFMSEVNCLNCNKKSLSFEPFNILPLSIPDHTADLKDCLKEFSKTELLQDDNKYKCEHCKQESNAEKKMYIWDLPELLIIQLKRFNNMGRATRKNGETIKFPFENLTFEDNYHQYRSRDYKYSLYGVVYHMGNLHGGHYISYTKNPMNNKWYRFNDDSVHHIPDESIEQELVNSGSYILFYKKNYKDSHISSGLSCDASVSNDDGFTSDEDLS